MTPIDIQVSRSKVSVEGQAYSLYVGEGGGISVLQTAIFYFETRSVDVKQLSQILLPFPRSDLVRMEICNSIYMSCM